MPWARSHLRLCRKKYISVATYVHTPTTTKILCAPLSLCSPSLIVTSSLLLERLVLLPSSSTHSHTQHFDLVNKPARKRVARIQVCLGNFVDVQTIRDPILCDTCDSMWFDVNSPFVIFVSSLLVLLMVPFFICVCKYSSRVPPLLL
ncbi:hypothetical protein CY34DRAFT_741597 [Suillus luteus UH-Slu-Lm8-n1]|uniref:Uncharacterized protein n=1 Tax=Suillus luteus UH-Slu-Lm8-n1 TaxID=930992 RepID=A0A0C9ZZD5_9AGAM|nr:hypothetical protein CY34DRAFT_741597 [Suillus luteus UH-Slu-Lm8-n1]